jgi:integrase
MTAPTTTIEPRRDFGYIRQLPSGKWKCRYRVGGKQFYRTCTTEAKAAQHLAKVQAEIGAGVYVAPDYKRTTFEGMAEMLTNDYRVNGRRSLDRVEDAIEHLRSRFRGTRAVAITRDTIDKYIAGRLDQDGAKPGTVQKELAALKRMFTLAIEARKLTLAQRPAFPKLEVNNVRTGFVAEAELRALVAALDERVGPLVEFMYVTGWRKSEALGLTWDRVDVEGKVVRLDVGTTKNKEGRTFPFTPALEALLKSQRRYTETVAKHTGQIITFVFHREGKPIRDFRGAWDKACERVGLGGLIPHDLRRSAVRNLVRAGVPEQIAMRLTGHKTRDIFDRYDIVDEADLRDGVAKLAAYAATQTAERKVLPMR